MLLLLSLVLLGFVVGRTDALGAEDHCTGVELSSGDGSGRDSGCSRPDLAKEGEDDDVDVDDDDDDDDGVA